MRAGLCTEGAADEQAAGEQQRAGQHQIDAEGIAEEEEDRRAGEEEQQPSHQWPPPGDGQDGNEREARQQMYEQRHDHCRQRVAAPEDVECKHRKQGDARQGDDFRCDEQCT